MTQILDPSTIYTIKLSDLATPSTPLAILEQPLEKWIDVKGRLSPDIFAADLAKLTEKL
jgi:hypothetical protein